MQGPWREERTANTVFSSSYFIKAQKQNTRCIGCIEGGEVVDLMARSCTKPWSKVIDCYLTDSPTPELKVN